MAIDVTKLTEEHRYRLVMVERGNKLDQGSIVKWSVPDSTITIMFDESSRLLPVPAASVRLLKDNHEVAPTVIE